MDYNTQRTKLIMPEYGRHVQKMIEYVMSIPDKEKRNQQIQSVIGVMGVLNPSLRDLEDYKHKLWDNVQIISNFELDIDSPYPTPTKETFSTHPNPIPLDKTPLKAAHYGRNIQNMIDMIAEKEDEELRNNMVMVLAHYMRHQYLIWNKDSVTEETIFRDIKVLSAGRIIVPEGMHLPPLVHAPTQPGAYQTGHRDTSHRGDPSHRNDSSFRQNYRGNKKKTGKRK